MKHSDSTTDFERDSKSGNQGLFTEFVHFLKENKKWWLLPILFAMLFVAGFILLGGTAAAPFIYTLF